MYCHNCGARCKDDENSCSSCGADIRSLPGNQSEIKEADSTTRDRFFHKRYLAIILLLAVIALAAIAADLIYSNQSKPPQSNFQASMAANQEIAKPNNSGGANDDGPASSDQALIGRWKQVGGTEPVFKYQKDIQVEFIKSGHFIITGQEDTAAAAEMIGHRWESIDVSGTFKMIDSNRILFEFSGTPSQIYTITSITSDEMVLTSPKGYVDEFQRI